MRLLLIEDDLAVAQSVELMLRAEDFQVETTALGVEPQQVVLGEGEAADRRITF